MPNKNRLAQRRNQKAKRNFKKPFMVFLSIAFLILILTIIFLFSVVGSTKYDRLSLAIAKDNGDVEVIMFDSTSKSQTSILIPKNVEVKAARQLGTWKLGSILKIGQNEGRGGEILILTITKSFKFPVTHWAEEKFEKSLFAPYQSNLSLADKISLGIMSLTTPASNKTEINLPQTGYLRPTKLADGEAGFTIKETIPDRLLTIFADPKVASEGQNITILDGTNSPGTARQAGRILEVLGGKVVSIKNENTEGTPDCQVRSKNQEVGERIARVFMCGFADNQENNILLILGKDFAAKF